MPNDGVELKEFTLEDYKKRCNELERENKYLNEKLEFYETHGPTKLYYALNRKSVEMANLLNNKNLAEIALEDPKDKTFERLKILWNESTSLSNSIISMANSLSASGNESNDLEKNKKVISAESMADAIGELAGMPKN